MIRLWHDAKGQSLGEYAIILGLIALFVVAVLSLLGVQVKHLFNQLVEGWPAWTTSK